LARNLSSLHRLLSMVILTTKSSCTWVLLYFESFYLYSQKTTNEYKQEIIKKVVVLRKPGLPNYFLENSRFPAEKKDDE
jgi:hypothetical protein